MIFYSNDDVRFEALNTKQRVLQLRLMTQVCGALTSDTEELVTRAMVQTNAALRQTGEECGAGLALLSVLLCRVPASLTPRLGELLSLLAVLARIHYGRADTSLVAANLPLLHFTQVTSQADTSSRL